MNNPLAIFWCQFGALTYPGCWLSRATLGADASARCPSRCPAGTSRAAPDSRKNPGVGGGFWNTLGIWNSKKHEQLSLLPFPTRCQRRLFNEFTFPRSARGLCLGSLMHLCGHEEHLGFKKLRGCSAALLPGDAVPGSLPPLSFPETPFPAQQLEWIPITHPNPARQPRSTE